MVAQPNQLSMSVENYLTLDRNSKEARYEFIDGYAYMLAGGTLNHSIISANVIGELRNLLRGSSCHVYTSDARVRLSETRYVYPDATVSCDARERGTDDVLLYPRLIIEVLSQRTKSYDRGEKFVYYRSCPSIEEYVLVDAQRQAVEVYRRASDALWTLHLFGSGDQVELASLGISFSIAALYENVTFMKDTPDSAEP